jgi:dTDP-4-amino-4,6-dideoxygalactose transaminase
VREDGNIDPSEIERKVSSRTRAIIPVHLAGLSCDLDAIWRTAARHGLAVIEDAAHAVGTLYRGEHLGGPSSRSDAVAYSFYANKTITTGEGGMLTTNNSSIVARLRMLALHGISRDAWKRYRKDGSWYYEVIEPGYKYNLSDLQSAIGIHQLRKLERFIQLRTESAALYTELLSDIEELELPTTNADCRNSWLLYMIRLSSSKTHLVRADFIEQLREHNIGTSVHFIPIPLQPFFSQWKEEAVKDCPRALAVYEKLVSLPLYPSLREQDIVRIATSIKNILANAAKRSTVPVAMVS